MIGHQTISANINNFPSMMISEGHTFRRRCDLRNIRYINRLTVIKKIKCHHKPQIIVNVNKYFTFIHAAIINMVITIISKLCFSHTCTPEGVTFSTKVTPSGIYNACKKAATISFWVRSISVILLACSMALSFWPSLA